MNPVPITSRDTDDEIPTLEEEDRIPGEEEEEDGELFVTLGFPEKPNNPRCLLRHMFPSKAGGPAAWLDPIDLPTERSRSCGFCREPLQFLLQVYSPLSEEFTFHRALFVFMCPSMQCLMLDQHEQWKRMPSNPSRSVKVFRCQMPRENPFYSSEPKPDGSGKPLTEGVPLCCWCGTWKGEKLCSSCKRVHYCSRKHQDLHWKAGHRSECHQIVATSELSDSNTKQKTPPISRASSTSLWPEFEIVIEDECVFTEEAPGELELATAMLPKHDDKDEMFQLFSDNFEIDSNKETWASFQERIGKAPEQVLRYCRDPKAKPLWAVSSGQPSKDDIPTCSYCSGPLCYEFQILPQLLYYFGVKNDVDSLDWATIVVYTCANSCQTGPSYKEEFAWVQLYPSVPVI